MNIRFNQTVVVEAQPVDNDGNPTGIQAGTAQWLSSDESLATVTPDPDNELRATIRTFSTQAAAVVSLSADGDPTDEGAVQIQGTLDLNILGRNAVGFSLTPGTPIDVEEAARA